MNKNTKNLKTVKSLVRNRMNSYMSFRNCHSVGPGHPDGSGKCPEVNFSCIRIGEELALQISNLLI